MTDVSPPPQTPLRVLIKGANDVASAVAHVLFSEGRQVLLVEEPVPSAVRRGMAFASAVGAGEMTVEGVHAVRVKDLGEAERILLRGREIPLLVADPREVVTQWRPEVIVDARMRKKRWSDTQITEAPLVIGLGPGFRAEGNAHLVIETNPGPHLGRTITEGEAEAYTGIPQGILGYSHERYLYAPADGIFRTPLTIGSEVSVGGTVGQVGDHLLQAPVGGIIRGILPTGIPVTTGQKLVDIDPRGDPEAVSRFTDRARAIASAVAAALRSRT